MSVPFLDLGRQVAELRPVIDDAIRRVLDDGRFALGPRVEQFEAEFAAYCGAEHAVGVASGTDAITIALQAAGVGAGDEVITAANTCVPTVAAIEAARAVPVLADVDPRTHTLDPACVEQRVTERTRAVVPVHLYGQCAEMEAITAVARRHGLKVIEDAAQAHGAAFRGTRAGTLGNAAAFSFYPTKNLGALGDGGAIVTNDAELADQARMLRSYGERERYDSVRSGWNSRLDTVQAAILGVKLGRLDEWTARRRAIAAMYLDGLADYALGLPTEAPGRFHVYHLFVVTVADRERFREQLQESGIGTLIHYPRPVHRQPAYAALAPSGDGLAVSESLSEQIVSLPLFPELGDGEVAAVIDAAREAAPA